ncbi:MAG TPA: diguanylate cyclase [Candidatus Elarobacter sp.]|nr:diguanylate cyclase [Candidatus Elarobacter sp.]
MLHSQPSRSDAKTERLSRVLDALDEGVIVTEAGAIGDANAAALTMLGLTGGQIAGREPAPGWMAMWDHGAPIDEPRRALRLAFQRARAGGPLTIALRRHDGSRGWIAISSRKVRDERDDEQQLFVYTLNDLTAQRELEQENAHYRQIVETLHASYSILEQSPIAMCSVDVEGQVVRGNMAFLALAGAETTSILSLVPEDERGALRDAFVRLVHAAAPPVRLETRVRRPSGGSTWCEITAVSMHHDLPDAAILLLINDVTERRRREARLRQLAERDPLTGLHNRRSFLQVLRERLASLERPERRSDAEWTLMLLDLDGFKDVNDTCGHADGDAVLIAVAGGIRDRTRLDDIVARLGGDEFAVLMQSHVPFDAIAIGDKIIARIAEAARTVAGAPPVAASIGIVRLRAGRGADATLAAADAAMYEAKRAGKARCVEAESSAG